MSLDELPCDLREWIFVLYRVGLRQRMARRRLRRTRLRCVHDELIEVFGFANGNVAVVMAAVAP